MKRFISPSILFAMLMFLMTGNASAQLTGTKTIPGTYASIAAAITDLNAQGVGSGGVIFNINPGYTETVPSGGLVINITTNFPTSANTVIFQRSGAGTNPLIQTDVAGSGTVGGTALGSNGDAMIKLVGADFITFNNINFQENYTGATQTLRTEYCILMVRASATDGCKNITINNCGFQQQQVDIYSSCIATTNFNAAGTVTNPTDINGRHENISVQGCTMNNSFNGMFFQGFNHASAPYDLYENGYNIGNVTGNTLTNIGTGLAGVSTAIQYGVYSQYVDSIKVNNNTIRINSGANNAQNYGILLSTAVNGFVDVINNNVCDTMVAGTTVQQAAIWVSAGSLGTNNTVNIQNNVVTNCRYFGATSGAAVYIALGSAPFIFNMTGNVVRDNTIGGTSTATGTVYGLYTSATVNSTVGSTHTISNNNVENLTRTQSAAGVGTHYGMYLNSSGLTTNIHNNVVDSMYNGTTTGALYGIAPIAAVTGGTLNTYNNTVTNIMKMPGATTGAIYGIYQNNNSATSNCYNNEINNLKNLAPASTGGAIFGYYNFGVGTLVENVYNNNIHDIVHLGTAVASILSCNGIYAASGPTSPGLDKNIYGNTIYNISVGLGQVGGMQVNYANTANIYGNKIYNVSGTNSNLTPQTYGMIYSNGTATSIYNIYNNFIQEIKSPNSPNYPGMIGLWVNGGATSSARIFYNTVYLDAVSTGTNFGTMGLYCQSTGTAWDIRNNIVVNKSVANGTGGNVAFYRATADLTNYSAASNNNNLYVTPSSSGYIYVDGTNAFQDMTLFKAFVAPRESNSFSENTPFVNTSSSPYDLNVSTTTPTLCESGGIPISSPFAITTDFYGTTRNATTPDVGADEFDGIRFPAAPNLVSPSNNATGLPSSVNLVWNRPPSSFSFRVDVATDNAFTNIISSDSTSDSTKALSGLTAGTTYYWRVKAYNILGEGPYSNVWNFTIAAAPTTAPVLVYPANGAVLVEVNPNMDWNSVPDATNYQLQISTDPGFGTTVLDTDTITATNLQLPNNFLTINTHYYWRVRGKSISGDGPYSTAWDFTTGVTNVEPVSEIPTVYDLYQNYPNPFNPSTKIKFDIPQAGFVSLKVYDITGREVAQLVNSSLEASRYEVEWNGSQFGSGVYFFRIQAGDFVKVQKMILTK